MSQYRNNNFNTVEQPQLFVFRINRDEAPILGILHIRLHRRLLRDLSDYFWRARVIILALYYRKNNFFVYAYLF